MLDAKFECFFRVYSLRVFLSQENRSRPMNSSINRVNSTTNPCSRLRGNAALFPQGPTAPRQRLHRGSAWSKGHKRVINVTKCTKQDTDEGDEETNTILTAGYQTAASRARVHAANIHVDGWSTEEASGSLIHDPLSSILLRECDAILGSSCEENSGSLDPPDASDVGEAIMARALDQIVLQSVLGMEAKVGPAGGLHSTPLQV